MEREAAGLEVGFEDDDGSLPTALWRRPHIASARSFAGILKGVQLQKISRPIALGMLITASSIALLFVWGIRFSLFDSKIDFVHKPLTTGGFFLWLLTGGFGAGLMTGGVRGGLKFAFGLFLALAAAFVFGWLRGNYS